MISRPVHHVRSDMHVSLPLPVPQALTWSSRHVQLLDLPELTQWGSIALGDNMGLPLHVVGAVYAEKLRYATAHGGQEPPPNVVRPPRAYSAS